MQKLRNGILAAAIAALPTLASADTYIASQLSVSGNDASTWHDDDRSVVMLDGPVHIDLDKVKMSADAAAMWISRAGGTISDQQTVEIALIGNAVLEHPEASAKRTGDQLFVIAQVRGAIRVSSAHRLARDRSQDPLFQKAQAMRDRSGLEVRAEPGQWRMPRPSPFVEVPETKKNLATPAEPVHKQVSIQIAKTYTVRMPDGTIAAVFDRGLTLTIRSVGDHTAPGDGGQITQLTADRGVVFTTLRELGGEGGPQSFEDRASVQQAIESVYLEGDVRISHTSNLGAKPDSTLEASHALYEIATDRAVLTDAVIHMVDPTEKIPIVMRASTIKQLSLGEKTSEYRLQDAMLTTSSFATPSYSVASEKTYVKQEARGDWEGMQTTYSGWNNTLDLWGVPVAWLPYAGGSVTQRGFPLRALDIGNNNRYGFYVMSEWGLFESIGRNPPKDLDLSYTADYLGDRGPAGGLNGKYRGSSISDTTDQAESFFGDFKSFVIYDHGDDKLGGERLDVEPPQELRGRVSWEHQQFLPDDWQVQLRTGWVSDPTFLQEYFPNEYNGIDTLETAAYIKHQRDSEAISLLITWQPNYIVTSQEYAAENFEIERMPELAYYRIADSLGTQSVTLYSQNTLSRLAFDENKANFSVSEMGFPPGTNGGITAEGLPVPQTGAQSDLPSGFVNRGDFRQEMDFPITIDRYRVLPYIVARYTGYDDSPGGGDVNRGFGGAGIRVTTQLWNTDNQIASDRWDIHRVRHVVEPELHVFGSVMNTQRDDVFVFDEPIDAINDIEAVQVALRQKWETKRGGPDNWHNSDFATWNIEGNFYANKPDQEFLSPKGFQSVFLPSMPEASIPRDGINSDESWRISDSTVVLSDQAYNLDEGDWATHAVGLAVRRGDRTTYYIGDRYINLRTDPLPQPPGPTYSNILSFIMSYELSTRYVLGVNQSYDFADSTSVYSSFSVLRRFDRFWVSLTMTVNDTSGGTGFMVAVRPDYVKSTGTGGAMPSVFK